MQRTSSATACGCDEAFIVCDTGKRLWAQAEIDRTTWTLTGGEEEFRAYDKSLHALAVHIGIEAGNAAHE